MLELRNICKTYKPKNGPEVQALKSVSVKFAEKGLVFILGKSGCGKSTLLNCIGGLDKFDSGEIIIKGKSSKEFSGSDFDSYRNTFLGFIFQEYNILSEFNIEKNIALALELQGKKATHSEVQKILDMVDLGNMGKRKTTELSGGQKQRVAIARALIKDPEIIIADEPTGALDSATGIQVFETLKKLAKDKLVIVVSHDREFAELYGDRIIEMKDGVIISDETKRKVAPSMVSEDLTLIGDDLIHIKGGHKFTQSEKDIIIKFLESRDNETIISFGDYGNKKFKQIAKIDDKNQTEKFTATTEQDRGTKQYDKNNLKLIKSRLKWKDSFKMGASSLKTKPVRLFFTILLSFIAFAIFGIVDTVGSFNRPQAVYNTIKELKQDKVFLLKENVASATYANPMFWTGADLKDLNEKFPKIDTLKIVNTGIDFGSYVYLDNRNSITFNDSSLKNASTNNIAKAPIFTGMTHVNESDLEKFGLKIVDGRLPEADNEIAISKHIYKCFESSNSDKIKSTKDVIDLYNSVDVNEYGTFKIVGIVDDGSDLSEYTSMTSEELNSRENMDLLETLKNKLRFGFSNIIYINDGYYNECLNRVQAVSYNLTRAGSETGDSIGDFRQEFKTIEDLVCDFEYYSKIFYIYDDVNLRYNSLKKHNGNPENLKEGTAVLDKQTLINYVTDYDEKIKDGTLELEVYDSKGLVKKLKVVGYYEAIEMGNVFFLSQKDANLLNSLKEDGGVRISYGATTLTSATTEYCSTDDGFRDTSRSWCQELDEINHILSIQHLKKDYNLVKDGKFTGLGKNEIIITENCFRGLGDGDELYNLVDSGLKVEFRLGYGQSSKTVFTFNVVGIANQTVVSDSTLASVIKPVSAGVDFVIAKLTGDEKLDNEFINYCETVRENNEKFTVQNDATPFLDQFGDMITSITDVVFWVGVGFAVFASLLLMNFISTSISYKKREIGILRALGARSSDVFGIFFNESMVIALINFVLATIATFVVVEILTGTIIAKLGIDIVLVAAGVRQIVLILGVSVLTAFLSSLIPVSGIARKQPIDAINNR